MSKKVFTSIISCIMAMCLLIGGMSTTTYAMESNTYAVSAGNPSYTVNCKYATTTAYMREWTIKNHTDDERYNSLQAPSVQLSSDARVHRVIFRFSCYIPKSDQGIGNEYLTVTVSRPGKTPLSAKKEVTVKEGEGYADIQLIIEGVSPGELLSVNIDASSSGTSNNHYRTIYIFYGQVYCD